MGPMNGFNHIPPIFVTFDSANSILCVEKRTTASLLETWFRCQNILGVHFDIRRHPLPAFCGLLPECPIAAQLKMHRFLGI